ncbi:hypothetical protein ACFLS9_09810, partial [Bacteroidota bacterium]
ITISSRKSKYFKLFLTITVFWTISLVFINCFYQNFGWRSHRVLMINGLLSNVVLFLWLFENYQSEKLRIRVISFVFIFSLSLTVITPLALIFSKSFILELLIVISGVLLYCLWFVFSLKSIKLYLLYSICLIGIITREPLLFLFPSILIVCFHDILNDYKTTLGNKPLNWLTNIVLVPFLVWFAYMYYTYFAVNVFYPNFMTNIHSWDGIGRVISFTLANLSNNLSYYFSVKKFPHDILYVYYLLIYVATIVFSIISKNTKFLKPFLTIVLLWTISLIFTLCVYENFERQSHRVFMLISVLSNIGILLWLLENRHVKKMRFAVLSFVLFVNLSLTFTEIKLIANYKKLEKDDHIVTSLNLAKDGDLAFIDYKDGSFHFLQENLECQVMWRVPDKIEPLTLLIEKAKPRFVIVNKSLNLTGLNYNSVLENLNNRVWLRKN